MEKSGLHSFCADIIEILNNLPNFKYSSENVNDDLKSLGIILDSYGIKYNSLRSILDPTKSIYSFIFNADRIPKNYNYVSFLMTKICGMLEKKSNCIFFAGDMIFKHENALIFSRIFESNNFSNDYIYKNNICIINILGISESTFQRIKSNLKELDCFLFALNITEPTIEKFALTYLIPEKTIKLGNKLIYSVSEEDDRSNYSHINDGGFTLVPIIDYYFFTYLTSSPLQFAAPFSSLKTTIKSIFNIDIKSHPKLVLSKQKYEYILKHAGLEITKKDLRKLILDSFSMNQIYNLRENIFKKDPVIIINLAIPYKHHILTCSLNWFLRTNIVKVITFY